MKLTVLQYDCDNCGLCCKQAVVWANIGDTMREPRIRTEARRVKIDGKPEDRWLMNRVEPEMGACIFHEGDKCGIYNSRPGVCASFAAGSDMCQSLRKEAGLQPLQPRPEEIEEAYIVCEPADLLPKSDSVTIDQPQGSGDSTGPG